jgi:hypothetical protein
LGVALEVAAGVVIAHRGAWLGIVGGNLMLNRAALAKRRKADFLDPVAQLSGTLGVGNHLANRDELVQKSASSGNGQPVAGFRDVLMVLVFAVPLYMGDTAVIGESRHKPLPRSWDAISDDARGIKEFMESISAVA